MSNAHYVYRVYDDTGQLIYVGMTCTLFARLRAHELNSWWAYQAARVISKVYPDRTSARTVEREAIRSEKPRWNVHGRGARETWSPDDYVDYAVALLNQGTPHTPSRLKHIQKCARHYRFRFGVEFPLTLPDEVAS